MILRISHFFSLVKAFCGFPQITQLFFFMYTNFSFQIKKGEVVLLNLSAREFHSLKNYYKTYKNGMCSAPADFLAQLAMFTGTEEVNISLEEISNVTGYLSRQCYEHLAKGKIAGLVKRTPAKIKNSYATKIHIPKFVLPCDKSLDQYIFDIIEHAYGYKVLFTLDFIKNFFMKVDLVNENLALECLQQSIDQLIEDKKLYLNISDASLKPKILHDLLKIDHCITIDALNNEYLNLNDKQLHFLNWINRTCGFYLHEALSQDQDQDQDQDTKFYVLPYKDLKQFKTDRLQYNCETKTYSRNGEIVE